MGADPAIGLVEAAAVIQLQPGRAIVALHMIQQHGDRRFTRIALRQVRQDRRQAVVEDPGVVFEDQGIGDVLRDHLLIDAQVAERAADFPFRQFAIEEADGFFAIVGCFQFFSR